MMKQRVLLPLAGLLVLTLGVVAPSFANDCCPDKACCHQQAECCKGH